MQTLASSFRSDGFDFSMVKRSGNVALFSKHKPGHKLTHYEVVIVQTHPAHTWPNGDMSPERESMPKAEDWGRLGWSPFDLQAAERRFNDTVDAQNLPTRIL